MADRPKSTAARKRKPVPDRPVAAAGSADRPSLHVTPQFGIRKVERPSAVRMVAEVLREEVFRRGAENSFLGSEEELIRRLGVSRPTFRQATGLLEHEQLLETRRGVGGGFYTRRPSAEAVSHLASVYLYFTDAKLVDLLRASLPVRMQAAARIAANPDPEVRGRLRAFLDRHAGFEEFHDVQIDVRVRDGFERLMAELCDSPTLHLFLEIGRHIGNVSRVTTELPIGKRANELTILFMRDLADETAAGNVDAAVSVMRSYVTGLIALATPAGAAP